MTTVETLRAARAKITDREDFWQQGCLTPGGKVGKHCALLAITRTVDEYEAKAPKASLARVMGVSQVFHIPAWNDSHTHAEVLAAFDRAIANEEAKAQEFTVEPIAECEPVAA